MHRCLDCEFGKDCIFAKPSVEGKENKCVDFVPRLRAEEIRMNIDPSEEDWDDDDYQEKRDCENEDEGD